MSEYKSVTSSEVSHKVEEQIFSELDAGNYVITNESPKLVSALGAILKLDPDEVRLIHDCSRPKGSSLSSHNTGNEHFAYQTVKDALKHIAHDSLILSKMDIRKGYHQLPIYQSNYQVTGLPWEFRLKEHIEFEFAYLYDTKLPSEASKTPKIFHRLSQSITRIMWRKGFTVIAYLDDFLLIEQSYE